LTALSGRNSFSIGLDQVTPFQQKGLNLLAEFISSAHFRDEVITREKTVLLEQLKQKRDSPSRVLMEEVHQKVFGTHPYGFELTGDEATIPKFTNVDLDVLWGEYQKRPWAWILVGDFKEDLWLEFFEKLPKVSSNYWVAPQPKIQVHKDMDHKKFLEKNQTHLAIVYPFSGAMTELQRLQHEILESVLAGQGGRLFVELRDKESLAYSVSPIRMEGLVGGYFGAYIACSPDKVEKAKVMMIDEFKKVVESGITETELERAKTYLIGRHDIQLQRLASLSSSLLYEALYGYSLEKLFDYAPTLAPIKASQIKTLGQEIFSRPCLMVEVGP
jgi:zinc protease